MCSAQYHGMQRWNKLQNIQYYIILLLEYTIYYIIHIQYTTEQNTEQKSTERIKTKPNKATTTQNPAESQPETCACLCVCGTFYAFISALPAQ